MFQRTVSVSVFRCLSLGVHAIGAFKAVPLGPLCLTTQPSGWQYSSRSLLLTQLRPSNALRCNYRAAKDPKTDDVPSNSPRT